MQGERRACTLGTADSQDASDLQRLANLQQSHGWHQKPPSQSVQLADVPFFPSSVLMFLYSFLTQCTKEFSLLLIHTMSCLPDLELHKSMLNLPAFFSMAVPFQIVERFLPKF